MEIGSLYYIKDSQDSLIMFDIREVVYAKLRMNKGFIEVGFKNGDHIEIYVRVAGDSIEYLEVFEELKTKLENNLWNK